MITTKENVIVYTIQIDTEKLNSIINEIDIPSLFAAEFRREGLTKEAALMCKGGFSYRETERNSYYVEYKVMITTRRKFI